MTYSTLASIVKYPFSSSLAGKKGKFGFFNSEAETFQRIADEMGIICLSAPGEPLRYVRHPLVYLVEAADDICYEIMDMEDAHKLKILSYDAQDEEWWSHNFQSPAVEAWEGLSFELLSLMHLTQIKKKLGISGMATSASSWRYVPSKEEKASGEKGAQIDLLIDRADRIINLCEMKFSVKPYKITDSYESALRYRMSLFQEKAKTAKTLTYTFVTTFGVANAIGHSIVSSEVTMDDLFGK